MKDMYVWFILIPLFYIFHLYFTINFKYLFFFFAKLSFHKSCYWIKTDVKIIIIIIFQKEILIFSLHLKCEMSTIIVGFQDDIKEHNLQLYTLIIKIMSIYGNNKLQISNFICF